MAVMMIVIKVEPLVELYQYLIHVDSIDEPTPYWANRGVMIKVRDALESRLVSDDVDYGDWDSNCEEVLADVFKDVHKQLEAFDDAGIILAVIPVDVRGTTVVIMDTLDLSLKE